MRAIAIERFGEPPRLMDLPDPQPGPGEVLVAVDAAAVNPLDWRVAEGMFEARMPHEFPLVLGFDAAGRVEAVGAGASRFAVGDRVFGQLWGASIGRGTFAESVVVPEEPANGALQPLPDGIAASQAAALPTSGMTALGALEATGCGRDQTLLVIGATGGVGLLVTQLAAAAGIKVIATARAPAQARMRELGASETIDYAETEVADAVAAGHPEGIDALLDLVGDRSSIAAVARHVRDGGAAVSIAFGLSDELVGQDRITATNYMSGARKPVLLERVGGELAAGRLTVPIEDEVALEQAPAALARNQAGGARGKTVIRP